jgi:opacity protein-like surface antigen
MIFRLLSRFLLTALFVSAASAAFSQTVYDAEEGKLPLSFGGGVSNFDPYFAQAPLPNDILVSGTGQGRMWGATGWADAGIRFGPTWLHPINIELQYRSIFAGGAPDHQNVVESNYGGGLTYTWYHFRNFHPYGKYIVSEGTVSFSPTPDPGHPDYSHDSRLTNSLGGGIEYRLTRHIWVRGDYEYQLWGKLLGAPEFSPQGFTIGAMYHLNKSLVH